MGRITKAIAFANNEIAFIAWDVDGMIDGCLGLDVLRIRTDGSEEPKGLSTWVPFEGQRNPTWTPQDPGVRPVQRLFWRDLTLRKHRSDTGRREIGFEVKYLIRPVGDLAAGTPPVPIRQPKAYDGPARPLGYLGEGVETNPVRIDFNFDGVRATFTNGILAGQWLKHAIESAGEPLTVGTIRKEIADRSSKIRAYLTGDVLDTLVLFLRDDRYKEGKLRLALYELGDDELVTALIENKDRIEVILSNSSKDRGGTKWDAGNQNARKTLKQAGVTVHDRMFNNSHIGHNKFAVWLDQTGQPRAVVTGSTNWTSTGICGQSNNALIVTSDDAASAYSDYWQRLVDDAFPAPTPPTAPGKSAQVQGAALRTTDKTPADVTVKRSTSAQVWFSPSTTAKTKGKATPPDLAALFDLMSTAEQAIFFLAFLPSRGARIASFRPRSPQGGPKRSCTSSARSVMSPQCPDMSLPTRKRGKRERNHTHSTLRGFTLCGRRRSMIRSATMKKKSSGPVTPSCMTRSLSSTRCQRTA